MDDLVDGMLSKDPELWEKTVEQVQALPRKQQTDLLFAMMSRLATDPPPIQGDLSRDQWLNLCSAHYREVYNCATNKQLPQYVSQGPSSGAEGGVAHGGNIDLQPVVQPLNEIRTLVAAIGDPVDEIRGLAAPVEDIRRSVAALPDPGPAIGALLPEIQAITPEIRAITPQIQALVPAIQAIQPNLTQLQQPLDEIRTRVNAMTDPIPGITSVLQALTGLQAGTADNMLEIRTLLLPLNEIRAQVSSIKDPVPEIQSLLQPLTALQAGASSPLPTTLLQPLNSSLVDLHSKIYTRVMGDQLAKQVTEEFQNVNYHIKNVVRIVDDSDKRNERGFQNIVLLLEEIKGKMGQPVASSQAQESSEQTSKLQKEIDDLKIENQKLIQDEQVATEHLWQSVWPFTEQQQQYNDLKLLTIQISNKDLVGIIGNNVLNLLSIWGNEISKDVAKGIASKKVDGRTLYLAPRAEIESLLRIIKQRFTALMNPLNTQEKNKIISTGNLKFLYNLKMFLSLIETCYDKEQMFPAALIIIAFNIKNATKVLPPIIDYTQFGVLSTGKTLYFSKVLDMFQISAKVANELQGTVRLPVSSSILNWDSDSWFGSFS
jgi:hypothetical protein